MTARTPITLITGSLGSGKTTLLKHILDSSGKRLAVLMNEFGEIAIDSQIIRGKNIEMVELAGGCVCCSLTGEFEAAVEEIIEKAHPEWIVVEATGVAEADALVFEVQDNLPRVRLDSVVCLVDAYVSIRYPQVGYTARTQLQAADMVVINKIDLINAEELAAVEAQVRQYNDTAMLFRTERCVLDAELLFGPEVERRPFVFPASDHEEFQSFVFTSDRLLDEEEFLRVVAELPSAVYRAKGFVRFREGSSLFNHVVGRSDLEEFPADGTQLVFIGPHLDDVRDDILNRLRSCEV
jgi:G3E family GTPase